MDPKRAVWMDVDESTTTAGAGPPSSLEGNEVRPQKEGCQESNSAQDLSVVDGSDDPVFFFFFLGFFSQFHEVWRSSTRGLSQIWLHVRETSRIVFETPLCTGYLQGATV
jgi:hypothetical protein